jgi:hypothetical protein
MRSLVSTMFLSLAIGVGTVLAQTSTPAPTGQPASAPTSLPFRSRGDVSRPTKGKIDGTAGGFKADQLLTLQKKSSGL